jgi:glyoxylase-like metal-dependent hydrolase (beta-lactamase superfamily II)
MAGCPIYASRAEKAFIESPEIEKSFLWGGFPPRDLDNKFFEAKPSLVTHLVVEGSGAPEGMAIFALPGHFFGMIGVLTDDGVLYLGDCMFGERTLDKYKIPFVYDVGAYKATIRKAAAIPAQYYVMSHGEVEADIGAIAARNLALVESVERDIEGMLGEGMTFEAILAAVCGVYGITLDVGQYALVGSTIRSFLSYLYNEGRITLAIRGNAMFWTRA